jgi:SRSO17 transposase
VLDDTGDRKDGTATAHVARQYLGSVGKVDNGIVAVTSLWADERCYWPVHAVPDTPASRLPAGERDPRFKTKPQLAVELVQAARQAGIPFRAVVADCCYGDNPGFTNALVAAKVPFVLALKPRRGTWAPAEAAHTPVEAAGELGCAARTGPGSGGGSSAASVTVTARLGGRLMGSLAAGARIGGCGWWWPPPIPPGCRR